MTNDGSVLGQPTTTTSRCHFAAAVVTCLALLANHAVGAFSSIASLQHQQQHLRRRLAVRLFTTESSSSSSTTAAATTPVAHERRPCFYRSPAHRNAWRPRLALDQLEIGQELNATVVQDLLQAKTGPKLFCEVGVGRYCPHRPERQGDWNIVTAMLRLSDSKLSVARKRASRLRKRDYFPVYVSRIRTDNAALEVCLTREEALQEPPTQLKLKHLQPGQVVQGRVVRVLDYGVLVDVGATRKHGLLHIRTVAKLLGRYIDKAAGLQKTAGLKQGTAVELQIANIANKEIALDFTPQAYEVAQAEQEEYSSKKSSQTMLSDESQSKTSTTTTATTTTTSTGLSKEEQEAWAAFAANPTASSSSPSQEEETYEEEEGDGDDYDDYDEDRDIEDALGLGYY